MKQSPEFLNSTLFVWNTVLHIYRLSIYFYMYLYGVKSVDDEKETEDVQIGNLGSDLPNHIDRKMWTEEDKDNLEV